MAKKTHEPVIKTVTVQLKVDVEIDQRANIWEQLKPYFELRLPDANPRDYSVVS